MKLFHISILFLFSTLTLGQTVTYNHLVDSTDEDTREVMLLFENYLASNPQNRSANAYWNSAEQEQYELYDFLESEFQPSLYMGFPIHVLSIKFLEDYCQLKVQFSYCKKDGTPYVLAIVNYLAQKEDGKYKLRNALTYNRQQWNMLSVGYVDYYYPDEHIFNYTKAQALNDFIVESCEHFDVQPERFEYYLAEDYDQIQHLKGIDYYLGMGGHAKPTGKASGNRIYCAGMGEYYPHEVFHVQIDKHFPNKHFWASEGAATFLGGSRGKSLNWHIKRTHRYLEKHPELDFKEMLNLSNLDSETAYHYVLGGLIVQKIWEKGGWSLVKELMNSGSRDEDYYRAIEELLGVPQTKLNDYIRAQLAIESNKK